MGKSVALTRQEVQRVFKERPDLFEVKSEAPNNPIVITRCPTDAEVAEAQSKGWDGVLLVREIRPTKSSCGIV